MNDTDTNVGGWPATSMRTFVNNDIYNAIPSEIKNAIIDTTVVSGHGPNDAANFTSTDKLYLLSTAEVWADEVSSSNIINEINSNTTIFSLPAPVEPGMSGIELYLDNARDITRQLDYYKNLGVTNGSSEIIKKNGTSASIWWLRSARSDTNQTFFIVDRYGRYASTNPTNTCGVAPAFRIG